MRIALFTETFIPKVDGIVTTLCQTIKQLKNLGHEVLILAPEGGFTEYENCRIVGIPGHAFPFYPELRLSPPHAFIRKTIVDFQPDLIHVTEPALLGIAGLYYGGGGNGGALRLPLVVSYHTDLPNYLRYYGLGFLEPWIWPLLRLRHNRATVNLCTSEIMVRQLEEHGIARVALWPGGVDADRFEPSHRSQTHARPAYRWPSREPFAALRRAALTPKRTSSCSSLYSRQIPKRASRWLATVLTTKLSSSISPASRS